MKIMDDNFDDHFMEDAEAPKKEETPHVETPEEREERELKESTIERRYNIKRIAIIAGTALVALLLVLWLWNHYGHVYSESSEKGVVMKIEDRGTIFKTYEGLMMSQRIIHAPYAYETDFEFSVTDHEVAHQLSMLAGSGMRVELHYKEYRGTLPWRGESTRIVTKIDTVK